MRKIRARVFKGTWFKGAVSLFVMFMAFSMMSFVSLAAEGKVKANTKHGQRGGGQCRSRKNN